MREFMDQDFMLYNPTGKALYHNIAAHLPIYDYHCHLSPQMIYEDQPFQNITQIFLGGDHYKWRYMRSCGVEEDYITGGASDEEKFQKFCAALQYGIGNPLYHWTHLELRRYFHIQTIVRADTAKAIWQQANAHIQETNMRPSQLILASNVAVICTTDDPADDLSWHQKIQQKGHVSAKVLPTFRPDLALQIQNPAFGAYLDRLAQAADMEIRTYADMLAALQARVEFFHQNGCRVSDHSMGRIPRAWGDVSDAASAFEKVRRGEKLSEKEAETYQFHTFVKLGEAYQKHGWACQLHIGALRNNNSRMFQQLGADTGFDSIDDNQVAYPLSRLMDAMEQQGSLPKMVLYSLNANDNYVLATMAGNFQSAEKAGKIQFGSGWWFNDQRDGMLEQLRALGNLGALRHFVGMLTDSRSFLSYTRHEYFRRILCNLLGEWVENGEFPADQDTLETIVKGICFENAKDYFDIVL